MLKSLLMYDFYNSYYLNKSLVIMQIFIGMSLFKRKDSNALWQGLLYLCQFLVGKLDSLHIINLHLGRISYSELGLNSLLYKVSKSTPHKYNMLYLCGVDFDTLYNKEFNPNSE